MPKIQVSFFTVKKCVILEAVFEIAFNAMFSPQGTLRPATVQSCWRLI